MTSIKALIAGFGLLVSSSLAAERVSPADLGLSVWVPDGWALASEGGDAGFRFYSLYDSTGGHQALFQLEVYSGTLASSGSSRQWTKDEALTREYLLTGECYSTLLSSDTMSIGGNFAREIYGRAAQCDSNGLGNMQDQYTRVTAYGDIGWVMSFQGDTADVDTASNTYLTIMDSISLDLNFSVIPQVGVKSRYHAVALRRVVAEGDGLRFNLATTTTPSIEVMDLRGRKLSGRLEQVEGGAWTWRPDRTSVGMVAVRVKSGSSEWMDRAVLPR